MCVCQPNIRTPWCPNCINYKDEYIEQDLCILKIQEYKENKRYKREDYE